MATNMTRFMLSLTPEIEEELNSLKQKEFYNESKSEMYRYVLSVGLETIRLEKAKQQKSPKNTLHNYSKSVRDYSIQIFPSSQNYKSHNL